MTGGNRVPPLNLTEGERDELHHILSRVEDFNGDGSEEFDSLQRKVESLYNGGAGN